MDLYPTPSLLTVFSFGVFFLFKQITLVIEIGLLELLVK